MVDIALGSLSASLYRARNVQVTTILEDMVDFFTYRDFTLIQQKNYTLSGAILNKIYIFAPERV